MVMINSKLPEFLDFRDRLPKDGVTLVLPQSPRKRTSEIVDANKDIPFMIMDGPCEKVCPSSKRKNEEYDEKNEMETGHCSVKKPCLDEVFSKLSVV
ncbi:unnamed protein product [Microthlaspi erraticum]|uniref:Uncharacterized protein n=1 Tax=Microthlaspi erraticum TaxID=1685480 RepID=A0A6D2KLG3_9BRAS|nr:unnamed protein product [Microthlaspi erraticum]